RRAGVAGLFDEPLSGIQCAKLAITVHAKARVQPFEGVKIRGGVARQVADATLLLVQLLFHVGELGLEKLGRPGRLPLPDLRILPRRGPRGGGCGLPPGSPDPAPDRRPRGRSSRGAPRCPVPARPWDRAGCRGASARRPSPSAPAAIPDRDRTARSGLPAARGSAPPG